jgi:hypothetical protein
MHACIMGGFDFFLKNVAPRTEQLSKQSDYYSIATEAVLRKCAQMRIMYCAMLMKPGAEKCTHIEVGYLIPFMRI